MLFLNISSDNIYISDGKKHNIIQRTNLERILPQVLKTFFETGKIKDIFVLNGPGSFTSLRISTLNLNLLNFVNNYKLKFYTISKPDFYKKIYDLGFLPRFGFIFIGQTKNFWLYDFQKNTYEQINISQISEISHEYFVDAIDGDARKIFDEEKIINIDFSADKLNIKYKKNFINLDLSEIFTLTPVETISPNYMIKPNIS